MTEPQQPAIAGTVDPQLEEIAHMWGGGWGRYFFPGFWLVYLGQTVDGVAKHSHGASAIVGYVLVALFAICYLAALPMGWNGRLRAFWVLYVLGFALTAAEIPFAQRDALVFCVYLSVLTVAARKRWAPASNRRRASTAWAKATWTYGRSTPAPPSLATAPAVSALPPGPRPRTIRVSSR